MNRRYRTKSPSLSRRRIGVHAACMTALLAGSVAVPTALSAPAAQAAEACRSGVPTYVHDVSGESGGVLRKYLDWDPLTGNSTGALLNTGQTAPLEKYSEFFTGGRGIIYVKTPEGALKTYKDNSATGGSMLTPVHDYGGNWNAYTRMWSTGDNRIFALHEDGALEIYAVANPSSGSGAITKIRTVAGTDPAVAAIAQANDVWSAGATVYTLRRGVADRQGEVKAWRYSESASGSPFPNGSSTVITGIGTKTWHGWSPGPGTIYTLGDTPDYTGIARSYTGMAPMYVANAEVGAGMYGDVHADIAACLASPSPDTKPTVGALPPETEVPPQAVNDESADPAPQNPAQFSGKFVLGDGRPAAGLPVTVEAVFVTSDSDEEVQLPTLGTTTTASDGTWTVTLPETLPESVQKAAAENGGAINAMASVHGKTSSGLIMQGTDMVTAAPATAPATARALATAAAEDTSEPSKLRPITEDMRQEQAQPTAAQTALSWASKDEQISVDTLGDKPLPEYQSDTAAEPRSNPYVVKRRHKVHGRHAHGRWLRQGGREGHRQRKRVHGRRRGPRVLGREGERGLRLQVGHQRGSRGQDREQLDNRRHRHPRLEYVRYHRLHDQGPILRQAVEGPDRVQEDQGDVALQLRPRHLLPVQDHRWQIQGPFGRGRREVRQGREQQGRRRQLQQLT